MDELKIVYLSLGDLHPYDKNARKHGDADVKAIAKSIQEFGFNDPIGVWGDGNLIVEGHGRLEAAKQLGLDTVPCIRLDHLTPEQRRAYALAHNKTAELSEWDFVSLEEELKDLEAQFSMEDFGFDLSEFQEAEPADAVDDDYDVDADVEAIAKRGDIFQLGRHRLMCGDSTDADDVAALMGGEQADLLLTDPPYNVSYEGGTGMTIMNDDMEDKDFREFLKRAFSCADAVMKPGASFYIWHADSEGCSFRGACHDIGWQVRQCLIWDKDSLVLGRQDYQWKHEPCLYGWKEGSAHEWLNDRKQTTVLEFERPKKSDLPPTMKPVPLFDYQIRNSCPMGGRVLDLFGGSGTTVIACEQDGRSAYTMELDPHYSSVIIQRYIQFSGSDNDVFLIKNGDKIPYSQLIQHDD